jgi:hypothetical protein
LKFSCPLEEALAHLVSVAHHATRVDDTAGLGGRPEAVRELLLCRSRGVPPRGRSLTGRTAAF